MRNLLPFFPVLTVFCKEYDEPPPKCIIKTQKNGPAFTYGPFTYGPTSVQLPYELICVGLEDDELTSVLENNFNATDLAEVGKIKIKHSPELKTLDLTSFA